MPEAEYNPTQNEIDEMKASIRETNALRWHRQRVRVRTRDKTRKRMDFQEFTRLVSAMRAAQRLHIELHTNQTLNKARTLERLVDKMISDCGDLRAKHRPVTDE